MGSPLWSKGRECDRCGSGMVAMRCDGGRTAIQHVLSAIKGGWRREVAEYVVNAVDMAAKRWEKDV